MASLTADNAEYLIERNLVVNGARKPVLGSYVLGIQCSFGVCICIACIHVHIHVRVYMYILVYVYVSICLYVYSTG